MKTLDIAIDVPSGKLVFANDMRDSFPEAEDDSVAHEGSGLLWNKLISVGFGKAGLLHGYTGNTCPSVYQDGNTIRVANARYDEDDEIIPGEIPGEDVGCICTDLWWFSAADYDDLIARGEEINDHYHDIVNVEPGRYIMRYNYEGRMDDDDPSKPAIYATIERSDEPVEDWKFPHEGLKVKLLERITKMQETGELPEGECCVYVNDRGKAEHRFDHAKDWKRYKVWGQIAGPFVDVFIEDGIEFDPDAIIKDMMENLVKKIEQDRIFKKSIKDSKSLTDKEKAIMSDWLKDAANER